MHGAGGARLRRGAEELKLDIYVKKVFRYLGIFLRGVDFLHIFSYNKQCVLTNFLRKH